MDIFADSQHIKKEREKARRLRASLWWKNKLAQGQCYLCKKQFPKKELTMEHLIPLARGGRSIKNNLVVCCKTCNSQKKHKTIVEQRLQETKHSCHLKKT